MWLVVGAAAALFVLAFAMLVIADDGWVATTGEALLVPVNLLVIIFGFSILPGGWTDVGLRSAVMMARTSTPLRHIRSGNVGP